MIKVGPGGGLSVCLTASQGQTQGKNCLAGRDEQGVQSCSAGNLRVMFHGSLPNSLATC